MIRAIYQSAKGDYLQRSRSYAFLITLAVTIYAAYSFVPTHEANYTTINITGYKGAYNSAWVGHVSAVMGTFILTLCGFFLVSGGIKKDIDTAVGMIIASTQASNFRYLLTKFLGNFAILLTISALALLISIVMFFIRNTGYPFQIENFLLPYLLIVIPAIVLVSGLAIISEVFLGRKQVLQYFIYIFIFFIFISNVRNNKGNPSSIVADGFGLGIVTNSIKDKVNATFHKNIEQVSLGYVIRKKTEFKTFEWEGVSWDPVYLLSRLMWIALTFAAVYLSSFFFHRFDLKQATKKMKKGNVFLEKLTGDFSGFSNSSGMSGTSNVSGFSGHSDLPGFSMHPPRDIGMELAPVTPAYGILPFVKTELLLMIRKDSKWLLYISFALWISTLFIPLRFAHTFLLPILLFLQVSRISDLTTKEQTNRLHYFTYAAYKPLQRILPAQLIAAFCLLTALSLPVICRLLISGEALTVLQLVNGLLFTVLLSASLGIISGSKKLFEILYFALTYLAFQGIGPAHYLGAIAHNGYTGMMIIFFGINVLLLISGLFIRDYQTKHQ